MQTIEDKYKRAPPEVRIWRYVSRSPHPRGCWLWTGAVKDGGYGCFTMKVDGRKRGISAHTAMHLLFRGPVPPGHDVCHACDNPACVNPDHIFTGTRAQNVRDMIRKGRAPRRPAGARHPLARMSEETVIRMRAQHRSGRSIYSLAKEYGVNSGSAHDAIKGITWKHVPMPAGTEAPHGEA